MNRATWQAPDRMPSRQDVQPKRPPESRLGTAGVSTAEATPSPAAGRTGAARPSRKDIRGGVLDTAPQQTAGVSFPSPVLSVKRQPSFPLRLPGWGG